MGACSSARFVTIGATASYSAGGLAAGLAAAAAAGEGCGMGSTATGTGVGAGGFLEGGRPRLGAADDSEAALLLAREGGSTTVFSGAGAGGS